MTVIWTLTIILSMGHPLESPTDTAFDMPIHELSIIEGNIYTSPIDGRIENIQDVGGIKTCTISNNEYEIVFPGLTEVLPQKGAHIKLGEAIGKDSSIKEYTNVVMVRFNKSNTFPQLINNKLLLEAPNGTPIYSPIKGSIEKIDYNTEPGKGNYLILRDKDKGIKLEYWHLQSFNTHKFRNLEINVNDVVGYTGNTGLSLYPRYLLTFGDDENFYNYKVIYMKKKT